MTTILIINGSYRDDGITDQTLSVMAEALRQAGATVEAILLRDYPIDFCLNCRACTQTAGTQPGSCVLPDGMQDLVAKIEASDAYILASSTNFGSVTALFKRFMERLIVYGYWPWGAPAPQYRKQESPSKKAVLVSSSAAPGMIARLAFGTRKQLKTTATTIGAATVGTFTIGKVSQTPDHTLPEKAQRKAERLAARLL